jgi:hypothetical protein
MVVHICSPSYSSKAEVGDHLSPPIQDPCQKIKTRTNVNGYCLRTSDQKSLNVFNVYEVFSNVSDFGWISGYRVLGCVGLTSLVLPHLCIKSIFHHLSFFWALSWYFWDSKWSIPLALIPLCRFLFFFFFPSVLGPELRAYTLNHATSPILWWGFLR